MKFYFLRHPETVANERGLIYGWEDYDYTEKGREMYEAMPERMEKYSFDKIYSSPLGRAHKLAEAIGQRKGMEVISEDRIKEMGFGEMEGISYIEAREKYPDVVKNLFGDMENFRVPGGENAKDVAERAGSFLDEIKEEDGSVLIVTHAMLMHSAMSCLLNMPRNEMWHFKIDPCMVVRIDYKDGYGVLKSMIPYEETDGTYIVDVK